MYKNICFIVAMKAEAATFIEQMNLAEDKSFAPDLPMRLWKGKIGETSISVVINGKDAEYNVDLIGTQAATLTTAIAITTLNPDLIISAGTAGGFASKGAEVGDVFLSYPKIVFHDRRVDIPGWKEMGIGNFVSVDTRDLARKLGLKTGVVTSGNSLDMSETDAQMIESIGGEIKEMEAAAVAWVASLYKIPMFCIKAITDLVDSPHATHEQFSENLALAVSKLTEAMRELIELIKN